MASVYVAAVRVQKERHSRSVELTMDFVDFDALARSYGYNEEQFLVALRRAGLTSVALSEELGATIGTVSTNAVALSGPALLAQSRLAALDNPTLARLIRSGSVKANEVYLVVYDEATYRRYRTQIPIHFGAAAMHILESRRPYVIAVRTQPDFFAATALGIPEEQFALARRLHLIVDPRVQNDERFSAPQIDVVFNSLLHRAKLGTVIFMGIANQVVGFPDHLRDTADALKSARLRFGAVEWYDRNQEQKGTIGLAALIPGRTTRVQAIAKAELDKLHPPTVVGRYLLGARERNVRVIYLRPYAHLWENRSIEATNVEIVRRIAAGLRAHGFTLGTATPVPGFRVNPIVVAVVSLAVPAIFLAILESFGIASLGWAVALFVLDLLLVAAGFAIHHDMVARKILALGAALLFPIAAGLAIAPLVRERVTGAGFGPAFTRGLRALAIAVGVAVAGGLVLAGLLSTPLTMEEIDRFFGVKAVLIIPPLVILGLYVGTDRFGGRLGEPRAFLDSPVRVAQLVLVAIIAGGAFLLISRSGNQSDVTPSAFELAFRSDLSAILSVRPRFKEFLVGWPLLMLLPALLPADRRALGWVFALGIGVGLADISDTFSHLHTPLIVSLIRVFWGVIFGTIAGAILIALYRRFRPPTEVQ
ncbi:MAG: hypothetical protein JO101_10035 [Candidatus Eremiobacteraeota bacterium]|nr:hypothetical protein [Candidatus Eremiobacteraeota bacterium]